MNHCPRVLIILLLKADCCTYLFSFSLFFGNISHLVYLVYNICACLEQITGAGFCYFFRNKVKFLEECIKIFEIKQLV